MSEREDYVRAELARILEDTDYRLGALVLTCPPVPGQGDVRIVSAILLKARTDAASDLASLPARLRQLAAELEAVVRREVPLPDEPVH